MWEFFGASVTFLVIGLLLVLAACVVKLFSPKAKIEAELPPTPDAKFSFYTKVHGVTFKNDDHSDRQKIINHCHVGEELVLIPEPENRFDANAIKICRRDGEMLGYWAGERGMARMLAGGQQFRVRVARVYPIVEHPNQHGVSLFCERLTVLPYESQSQ